MAFTGALHRYANTIRGALLPPVIASISAMNGDIDVADTLGILSHVLPAAYVGWSVDRWRYASGVGDPELKRYARQQTVRGALGVAAMDGLSLVIGGPQLLLDPFTGVRSGIFAGIVSFIPNMHYSVTMGDRNNASGQEPRSEGSAVTTKPVEGRKVADTVDDVTVYR
ncbi:MAG: hypothetical protein HY366_02905 [Candidatus Aenigmarchaeota archaeon]|nr:hypothetical protein [Candidatus Aenigmarchaeota archaeon]